MKTILIAGGAGFIGSNLAWELCKDNNIIVVDNLYSGVKNNLPNNVVFINHDIREPIDIDEIYNLACPASPKFYQKSELFTIETCYMGTKNLLELAKKYNAKFLQASTSEVYGDPIVHPQIETYRGNTNTYGPRSCYDEGKRITETLCYIYRKDFNVDAKVIRIFNTYGPRMRLDDGRVITNFINQALNNKPLTIYGSGTQTRSIQFISDLVRGMILVMESNKIYEPINLGNPIEMSILNIAKLVQKITKQDTGIIYENLPIDDPKQRMPDITKAKTLLNWTPIVSPEEGILKTIDFINAEKI